MSVKLVVALYDVKAELFHNPFTVPALGVAYRNLADQVAMVGDKDNVLSQHPGDFELWKLGVFDDETGFIQGEKQPAKVCLLSDLVVVPV